MRSKLLVMSGFIALLARDPVSGTAYYVSLLIFAAMPWSFRAKGAKGP